MTISVFHISTILRHDEQVIQDTCILKLFLCLFKKKEYVMKLHKDH